MADKKKGKTKNRRDEELEKPTNEELSVAKFLRFGLKQQEAKLVGMTVKYFIASEAVDKLLESKWATSKNKQDNLLHNRQSCVNYMDRLLRKGLFHRASRVEKKKRDEKSVKSAKRELEEAEEVQDEKTKLRKRRKDNSKEKEKEKEREKEREEREKEKEEDTEKEDKKKDEKDKKKKEKKMKLRMHDDQVFYDGDEVYVWIYDPVNVKTFIIGLLMVLGTIGMCLFPLWPPIVRQGVYYLSLGGAVFVGLILFLAVLRFILFCAIWAFTGGRHHFWFLPNLTEDVGFLDSFRPVYTYTYKGKNGDKKDSTKSKKNGDEKETKSEKESKSAKEKTKTKNESGKENSDSSDNGYEIVEKSEVTDDD